MSTAAPWQPLTILDRQFRENLAALAGRHPTLAKQIETLEPQPWMVQARGNQIIFGVASGDGSITPLPNTVPAAAAVEVTRKLFPGGKCTEPIAVVGLDQGWLWRCLFQLEISTPAAPGHQPPLYFFCRDLERLWAVMHLHDWRQLLASRRVRLHCGEAAVEDFARIARERPELPFPRLSVTVEPALWPAGMTIDTIYRDVVTNGSNRFTALQQQLATDYAAFDLANLQERIQAGSPLRIMGVTSRYTTFLKYSMCDWLESMNALGHSTHLVIEEADHHFHGPMVIALECERFKPDLVVSIDHYRGEIVGIPQQVPCVMWVQDRLPNIFCAKAGSAQGPLDYVIGQGRVECVHRLGYPSARFMPAMIGTNEKRFATWQATADELAKFGCEVSFVTHCSTPAEVIIQEEIRRLNSPASARLLQGIFDQLRAIYDAGQSISQLGHIESIIRQTLRATQTSVEDEGPLVDLFTHKINNALFRHQAIGWVAEMGVDLRLYGRGWEQHPRFARFARGIANNQDELAALHRASKINLQITPFGAAHQRLFDGLACGGFFLLRGVPGDRFDQCLRQIWLRCGELGITNDAELLTRADESLRDLLKESERLDGQSMLGRGYDFVSELAVTAEEGFTRSAGTLWPEFDRVAFHNREQLQQQIRYFLSNPEERASLAESMRQRVLENLTYRAVSRRMLKFIADDLGCATIKAAA